MITISWWGLLLSVMAGSWIYEGIKAGIKALLGWRLWR